MKIGFTGSRKVPTLMQGNALRMLLETLDIKAYSEFHHGDCVGSDTVAHLFAEGLNYKIFIHPPYNDKHRSWCKNYFQIHKTKDYQDRNKDIVNMTEILIATPETHEEVVRSGTWATIRYAIKQSHPVFIIGIDGLIEMR